MNTSRPSTENVLHLADYRRLSEPALDESDPHLAQLIPIPFRVQAGAQLEDPLSAPSAFTRVRASLQGSKSPTLGSLTEKIDDLHDRLLASNLPDTAAIRLARHALSLLCGPLNFHDRARLRRIIQRYEAPR